MRRVSSQISIMVCLMGVALDVIVGLIIYSNISTMTVNQLFICFTLIPMLLVFVIPFFAMISSGEKSTRRVSFLFCVFVYLFNYMIIDSLFSPAVITQIYENSDLSTGGIDVSSSTDWSSMLSTIITILALYVMGIFLATAVTKAIQKSKRQYVDIE